MKLPPKRFRVAFSFAGEKRDFVGGVAAIISARFDQGAVLYDKYHEAEFSRRDLAFYLPDLYHDQSDLVVVVACSNYEKKEWCGLEWDAIFDLLKQRENNDVMLCRFDRAIVKGIYSTAGFVELDDKTAEQAAALILERLALNEGRPKDHYLSRTSASRPAATPAAELTALSVRDLTYISKKAFVNWLVSPSLLRPVFRLLRSVCPILVLGKRAVITRHADVVEVLSRDTDFTISEINEAHFAAIDGPFFLGMDRSPEYEQEVGTLREVVRADDLERIREFVTENARVLVEAASPSGRIDVVHGLARVVPIRLVESYFGIPPPDDPTMMHWLRVIFYDLFGNLTNDSRVHSEALRASEELRRHADNVIASRQSRLGEPKQPDDVLGRLLTLQHDGKHSWIDNDFIRRNLRGLIIGAVETTSKCVTLAVDELLRRPNEMENARKAALADDLDTVRAYAYEALRFNPPQPGLLRFCRDKTELASGTRRARRIPAGATVFAATLSAMFDPDSFAEPNQFRIDRGVEYLHFGDGLHRCFGYHINGVQIPALLAALLRLPNLRRAAGPDEGLISYHGPFPNSLILEFDK